MNGSHRWKRCLLSAALVSAGTLGCQQRFSSTDVMVDRMEETRGISRGSYVHMADNALLHDMSLADLHFVAHTNELSGTGAARLDRMAYLLDAYGGTVRYDTLSVDESLVSQRLEHIREYLALTGCDMDKVEVKLMLSGGRGMAADDAIEIKQKGVSTDATGAAGGSMGVRFGGAK